MYIVWRQKQITSDKAVELFHEYDDTCEKRQKWSNWDMSDWLLDLVYCRHKGPGRIVWTPLLVHSERKGGKSQQKVLHRFHSIRTCCFQDPIILCGWWSEVNETLRRWKKWGHYLDGFSRQDEGQLLFAYWLGRDEPSILAKLREVVPQPTSAARKSFAAYEAERAQTKRQAEEEERKEREAEKEKRRQERAKKGPYTPGEIAGLLFG